MIKIRKIDQSDHEGWIRMRKALWPECPDSRHNLETKMILSSNGIILGAEITSQELVGFVEVSIRNDHVEGTISSPTAYLEGWFVESSHRGRGIGKALLQAAENNVLKAGFFELASDAEIDNQTGIEIHKHLGFKEVERTVHFVKRLIQNQI